MDIDDLRLTPDEYREALQTALEGFSYHSPQLVADAQLSKAVRVITEWLSRRAMTGRDPQMGLMGSIIILEAIMSKSDRA